MKSNTNRGLLWFSGLSVLLLSSLVTVSAQESGTFIAPTQLNKSEISKRGSATLISYKIPELNWERVKTPSSDFIRLKVPGHFPSQETGMPELPLFTTIVSFQSEQDFSINISDVDVTVIALAESGINDLIYPAQPGRTKNQEPQSGLVINSLEYRKNGWIAIDTVIVEFIGRLKGEYLYNIRISPVRYNPVAGKIEVITKATILLTGKGGDPEILKSTSMPEAGALDDGYNLNDVIPGFSQGPQHMIILTDTIFRPFLTEFLKWKRRKGIETTVLYKGANYAGTTFETMKESIRTEYNNLSTSGSAPSYLLIIGDLGIIPRSGGTLNISDLYYAEMDGGADYIPDMYYGRLPVADTTRLKTLLSRLIRYEKNDFGTDTSFLKKTITTAGNDGGYATYMNGQVNYAASNYLNQSASILNHKFLYPQSYSSDDSIKTLINSGVSFINYTGHGDPGGWLDPVFKVSDVIAMTNNNKPPFIITNACRTAQINVSPNFGVELVTHNQAGAIGFIGCTNDSYWLEDYYWSVGVGTPVEEPLYNETGLGIYDRLFHKMGESPSDWYITMGQINFAGNMAVSASTSPRKKYYWETYILLGDPSIIPVIGNPVAVGTVTNEIQPQGITKLDLELPPFAFAAISDFNNLWDAGHADPNGFISLQLPLIKPDSALLVITGQNLRTMQKTLYFSTSSDPYLVIDTIAVDDASGNGDGVIDFGESADIYLTLRNLGSDPATGVFVKMETTSPFLTILNDSIPAGSLAGGQRLPLTSPFSISCSPLVPDLHRAGIRFTVYSLQDTVSFGMSFTLHASDLSLTGMIIDDSVWGNNNQLADAGEKIVVKFMIENKGSSSTSGVLSVGSTPTGLTFEEVNINTGVINNNGITTVDAVATIGSEVKPGTVFNIDATLNSPPSLINRLFTLSTGMTTESFEHMKFTVFPWNNTHSYPWIITGTVAFDGAYSARSAAITDLQESKLSMVLNTPVADSMSFMAKVSSESKFDFLIFKNNGSEIFRESGEIDWFKKKIGLVAGINRLEWIYSKDKSLSVGQDAAWIDFIKFPSYSFIEKDLQAVGITHPDTNHVYGPDEKIRALIANMGRDTISSFGAEFSINGNAPWSENFSRTILPGDTAEIEFTSRCKPYFHRHLHYSCLYRSERRQLPVE